MISTSVQQFEVLNKTDVVGAAGGGHAACQFPHLNESTAPIMHSERRNTSRTVRVAELS